MRTKMVITWIFFVVFLGTSKSLFAQTISINIKNATLEETLKKIKQVSGFDMVFKMKDIKDIKKHINLQVEDKDIREVLQSCLQEHDLIFNINVFSGSGPHIISFFLTAHLSPIS